MFTEEEMKNKQRGATTATEAHTRASERNCPQTVFNNAVVEINESIEVAAHGGSFYFESSWSDYSTKEAFGYNSVMESLEKWYTNLGFKFEFFTEETSPKKLKISW